MRKKLNKLDILLRSLYREFKKAGYGCSIGNINEISIQKIGGTRFVPSVKICPVYPFNPGYSYRISYHLGGKRWDLCADWEDFNITDQDFDPDIIIEKIKQFLGK